MDPLHFFLVVGMGKIEVVKVLLKDSRVEINMADNYRRTPLWWASRFGQVEVIKWVIVSGREINLDKKGKWISEEESTAIEIAREKDKPEAISLLERLMANLIQTRHEVRVELGLVDKDATELFDLTVFSL
jgi:ankyrin repeat protein